ncbi:hypothetical protein P0R31_39795 [Bradyrhizobium yuanmingense]|uniref:hypothetical protein n=1 Tax=Bradyrhizobium yuanmingense TaxID=108015 RepID=UPI0023B9C869|nr:hypothetical protein [Bradyrhizobium yuanmingense]MDF0523328.1 hypothetical protein [Bradyrhizobium yuanmingense]
MFVVIVETQIDAERRAGRSAYIAKLVKRTSGAVEQELGLEVLNYENRRALAMLAWPTDVLSAWRCWQIGNEEAGGEVLFTVDDNGDVIPLKQNEADALLAGGGVRVLETVGHRPPPMNVFCRPASLSGQSILRGRL